MKKYAQKIVKFIPILFILTFVPFLVFAQPIPPSAPSGLAAVINKISALLSSLLPVLISLGVLYFIWGVIIYFIADDAEAKSKGKDRIIYGIIGLAVIVSVWGLVAILNQTLGLSGNSGLSGVSAPSSISNLAPSSNVLPSCSYMISNKPKLANYLEYFTCIIAQSVIPLIFAIAVVTFIWGAVKFFIINAEEEAKRDQGKQFMLWGIIALAVMISVWGLVKILGETVNIDTNYLPSVQPYSSSRP